MKYSESKINPQILSGLAEMGFVEMTPIQELAIPQLLSGRDIIGQAQTGTGKTAAFGIPMIESVEPAEKGVQGLVLCPTRELAVQVAGEMKKMAAHVPGVKVAAVYGGQEIEKQFQLLRSKISIVVGTPGRVMDHMRRGTLRFDRLRMLVLDEADEMLNMGFREDIETICGALPTERQTALFSATMAAEILEITQEYQRDAKLIRIDQEELTVPQVKQFYYVVKGREKDTALCRLLDYLSPKCGLIFCNTKRKVDQLTLLLKRRGYSAEALHGDLSQHQRDRVMQLLRSGNLQLLLATDVAARGIDVEDVDMVFNYDMPQDMEFYVHRIGRTGRAGRKGRAVSLITPKETYKIESLSEYCNTRIRKKEMPSAADALTVKAYQQVTRAQDYCRDTDLTAFMKIVYKRCVDDGIDPLEIAAAFLRMSLGEIEEDAHKQVLHDGKTPSHRAKEREKGDASTRGKARGEKDRKKGKRNGTRTAGTHKNRRHDKGRPRARKK